MMQTGDERAVDLAAFRSVLGHFASGLVIVAGMCDHEPVGFTCQSFFAVSLVPPLIAICPARTSTSWPRIAQSGSFSISMLSEEQEHVARGFAASGADKFRGLNWELGHAGPRLVGALAWLDCSVHSVNEAGDHLLVLAAVHELEVAGGRPLLYYRSEFGRLGV